MRNRVDGEQSGRDESRRMEKGVRVVEKGRMKGSVKG